jgi:hypothetical protein
MCSNWEIVDYSNLQFKTNRKQLNYHTQLSTKQKNNLTIKAMVRIEMQLTEEEVAIIEQIAKEESRSRKSNVKLT